MIIIDVKTPFAKVDCTEREKRKLYKAFSIPVPYAFANPKTRDLIITGKWDGKSHLFNRHSGRIPFGLAFIIQDMYNEVEINGLPQPNRKIIRKALRRLKKLKLHGIEELGDFQRLAIERMIRKMFGIVKVATNGGKTEIASGLIKCLGENINVLYMIHTRALLHQTAERIQERTGIKCGKLGDGIKKIKRVTVAMVQSLPKAIKANEPFYNQWDVLIMDEAQHASASTWYSIAMKMKANWRFALSGTPWTGDDTKDARLISAFSPILLADVRNKQLINRGWSAKPTIHVHELRHYRQNDLPWRIAYDTMVVNDSVFNEKVVKIAKKSWLKGHTTMVMVNRKAHGLRLYRRMLGEKIDVKYLSSGSPDIQKHLKRFKEGKLGVIICTPIFDEGVDVPAIRTLVLAAAGKAPIRLLQRIGRALRKKKTGKNVADIHDFIHYGNGHLEDHSLRRMEIHLQEEFDIRFHKSSDEFVSKRYHKTGAIDWGRFHEEGRRGVENAEKV